MMSSLRYQVELADLRLLVCASTDALRFTLDASFVRFIWRWRWRCWWSRRRRWRSWRRRRRWWRSCRRRWDDGNKSILWFRHHQIFLYLYTAWGEEKCHVVMRNLVRSQISRKRCFSVEYSKKISNCNYFTKSQLSTHLSEPDFG